MLLFVDDRCLCLWSLIVVAVCRPLWFVGCVLLGVCWLLLSDRCVLSVVRCWLYVICCVLVDIGCLLCFVLLRVLV